MRIWRVGRNQLLMKLDCVDYIHLKNLVANRGGVHWHNMGYAEYVYQVAGKRYRILVHRLVAGWAGMNLAHTVDHWNGDKLDNQRNNLRSATQAQQTYNEDKAITNATGYKGVHVCRGRYRVTISHNGHTEHVGMFDDPVDAANAYDRRAVELRGEFAKVNFYWKGRVLKFVESLAQLEET